MTRRKKPPSLGPHVNAVFEALATEQRAAAERLQGFIDGHKDLPTLERAEAWLAFVTETPPHYFGDEEAVTFLALRGAPVEPAVARLIERWKEKVREAHDSLERGISVWHADTGEARTEPSPWRGGTVRSLDSSVLRNFWYPDSDQDLHIDAAMLRAVDACQIGGFDEWWERLAREERQSALTDGISQIPLSYWLANMCRSRLAMQLLGPTLELRLEAAALPPTMLSPEPWVRLAGVRTKGGAPVLPHWGVAANLGMAAALLSEGPTELGVKASNALLSSQLADGSWCTWGDADVSVETTARAIHCLALNQPRGWQRACERAAHWLVSQQAEGGYWQERGMMDARFLTVLVLDALGLASGGRAVTSGATAELATKDRASSTRFAVGLSFPGEARVLVEQIAVALAGKVGRDRVLYDKFYEAEFARPNLDVHLQRLYREECDLIVVFVGSDYERKDWPGLEWRAIRDIIKNKADERVMFLRLDDGPVSGVFGIDGYISVASRAPNELANLIAQRLGRSRQQDALPSAGTMTFAADERS